MIAQYIDRLLQSGKTLFSGNDVARELGISHEAATMALLRLKRKGQLVSPYKGIYVPIPPEYRSLGCLPAEQLLPPLMNKLGIPYYVCLLSAAVYYGAGHQRPQITQVMVAKRIFPIHCGDIAIKFIYKKTLEKIPISNVTVRTGYLAVSSVETTIMDLLLYPRQSGGVHHIATVLDELAESIDVEKLIDLVKSSLQHVWVQRLGYLLEFLKPDGLNENIIVELEKYIGSIKPSYTPLAPNLARKYPRDRRWRVIVNVKVESDI